MYRALVVVLFLCAVVVLACAPALGVDGGAIDGAASLAHASAPAAVDLDAHETAAAAGSPPSPTFSSTERGTAASTATASGSRAAPASATGSSGAGSLSTAPRALASGAGGRLAGSGTAVPSGVASADAPSDAILETATYRQLPDEPDRVEVELRYDVPEDVESLSFAIVAGDYSVVGTDGFDVEGDDQFHWDGQSTVATVTIRHDVDESFRPEAADDHYVGGTDDWAIVARPQTETHWSSHGGDETVEYRTTVDGEGRAGERLVYLGPYEAHQRTAAGEQLTLVVPEAAELGSPPEEILDSVAHASERLRVGNRNDELVLIAAPTDDGVEWSPPGLSLTSDARVVDDARVDDPVNVWVHEYVHTRQHRDHFDPGHEAVADDARWFVEGSADYYAALIGLEQGHVGFETFQEILRRGAGGGADDAVLAEPETWSEDADYRKGALVAAAIDRQIRLDSDGEHTLQDVVREWNRAETFTASDLEDAAAEYGDESTREFVRQYTRTSATPELWDRDEHRELFEADVAQFRYAAVSDPPVSITGPYRTGELGTSAVTGETVAATVEVENVGDVAGGYRAVLSVGGRTGDAATGRLGPGESESVRLEHRLDRTGTHSLVVGDHSRRLEVSEPASPQVTEFSVASSRPAVGDDVPVTVAVENPEHRPASGEIAVRVDGEVVDTTTVRLPSEGETTVELTATFAEPGERTVAVGDATLTVDAREPTVVDRLPGFGVVAALLATLVAAALLARRD